jgi:tripartite-type tricarboxylate transporter receptor subunit TctC
MSVGKISGALLLCLVQALAGAHGFPERPVRIVVPYVPGGSTDLISRLLADAAAESLGQNVIVENRPGAGGMLGTSFVAKSAPDGHTLVICTVGTCAVNPTLVKNPGYDLFEDFQTVILLRGVMNVFVVNNSVPVKTPRAAVDKLNAAFNAAMKNPKVRARLEEANLIIAGGTPEQMATHMRVELERWAQVIKANKISVE